MRELSAVLVLVCACGGSDDGGLDLQISSDPTAHERTSYQITQDSYRWEDRHLFNRSGSGSFVHAFGYADFDGDGSDDALVFGGEFLSMSGIPASLTLDIDRTSADGSSLFQGGAPEGIHPRKLLIGDINGDAAPDAVLIDHGFDADPFPGAPVTYVLSNGAGQLTTTVDDTKVGFHHAGALGDFDNDGDLDLFVASSPWQDKPHQLLVNDGSGAMTASDQLVGGVWNENIWSSEFLDLDGDGFLDLLIGGDNNVTDTMVLWGSTTGKYGSDRWDIELPHQTYDFDAEDVDGDGDRDLLITLADLDGNQAHLVLYINMGDRTFLEDTSAHFDTPGHDEFWFDFSFFVDLGDDGDLDIVADDFGTLLSWDNEGGVFTKQPAVQAGL